MSSARGGGGTSDGFPVRTSAIAVLLVIAIGSAVVLASRSGSEGERDAPNFVLIVTDDQRWDTLDAMPAVRRHLVDGGITFTNAFATTPSCCPSRVSLLTGQYSHTTGVLDGSADNAPGGAPAFADRSSLATWLDDAGYRTGLVGKYLNDYGELPLGYVPPGWDEWFAVADSRPQIRYYDYRLNENGTIVDYGDAPTDYSTSVLQEKAVDFIRDDRPFFLVYAPLAPHLPAIPAPQDSGTSVPAWGTPPPSFDEDDVSDKPGRSRQPLDVSRARSVREDMLRSLLSLDRSIEAIVRAVEAAGAADDTYIFFTSDNGFLWGEHRVIGKVWPYEESIRVPLVIRPPGRRSSRTLEQAVLNIDIPPTIAELAGIDPGLRQDGRSMVPLLRGTGGPWRDAFVVEFLGFAPGIPPYVGVRTRRHIYIEYRNGWRELYDLRTDPFQLRNLLAEPSASTRAIVRELRAALDRMAAGSGIGGDG
jgi:N-acetylglucosamine-6-sulfatase